MQAQSVYNQGLDKVMLGAYREAIHDFSQALSMEPDNIDIYYNRGLIYLELGNKQEALEDLETAAQLFAEQDNMLAYQNIQNLLEIHF
jgi:tetratricopeptide (TPR) repeat protein